MMDFIIKAAIVMILGVPCAVMIVMLIFLTGYLSMKDKEWDEVCQRSDNEKNRNE